MLASSSFIMKDGEREEDRAVGKWVTSGLRRVNRLKIQVLLDLITL